MAYYAKQPHKASKPKGAPIKIQLALQGGGAKLCGLLAAMDAVQELHRRGIIQVTRIAGTSAGSIAACLFAAGADLGSVRERFKVLGTNGSLNRFKLSPFSLP